VADSSTDLVKRARKYHLGVTTITQDVEDFVNSEHGKAIVTNSSLQLLLKQSPASIDAMQNVFKLTDQEKYILLNAPVGQGLFLCRHRTRRHPDPRQLLWGKSHHNGTIIKVEE
jgi:type IV secretory pathway VirB4 component